MSSALPWHLVPYGKQMYKLLEGLVETKQFNLYYMGLYNTSLDNKIYTYKEIINCKNDAMFFNEELTDKQHTILQETKFLGHSFFTQEHILISNINILIKKYDISCFIVLMDLTRIITDTFFSCKSFAWYPNHFNPINEFNKNKLQAFSHIVSLSPSDTELLKHAMHNKEVVFIPHIIELNYMFKGKQFLREKYNVPKDAFVVLINAGNYDYQNRKSFDTSIFAFEKLVEKIPNSFLYIRTFNISNITDTRYKNTKDFMDLRHIMKYVNISSDQYIIEEKIRIYDEILEIMEMSDVLLQGSKSEGFGVPVLEAQVLGVPVVTNKFGAMGDYTFYGISVPSLQKSYDNVGKGIWSIPNVDGLAQALEDIYNKNFPNNAEYARNKINEMMSSKTVLSKFINIISNNLDANNLDITNSNNIQFSIDVPNTNNQYTIINYNNLDNNFNIDYKNVYLPFIEKSIDKKIKDTIYPVDIIGQFVLFIDNNVTIQPNFIITNDMLSNDIILLATQFKTEIYPTKQRLELGDIQPDKIYYLMNANIFKIFIEQDNHYIENKYLRSSILLQNIQSTKDIKLCDNIYLFSE